MPRLDAGAIATALGQPPPTPEQVAVIEAPPRPTLVIAGAGSGKTETMAARVVWLVANGLVEPDQVLGLTFTRKAATELSERIDRRLTRLRREGLWTPREEEGAEVLGGSPTVSTYHAYAGRLVREHGLRLGYEADSRLLSEAAAWQYAHEAVLAYDGPMDLVDKSENTVTAAVVDLAGEMAEHLRGPDEVAAHLDEVIAALEAVPKGETRKSKHPASDVLVNLRLRRAVVPIVARYRALKRARDAMDFADQMALAAELAIDFADVGAIERDRYAAVLLDEFQDTSEAQLALLRALFATGPAPVPVTAVGDPHQSIYGWRGASATTLSRFPEDFATSAGPAPVLPLSVSWRNDRAILSVANEVAAPLLRGSAVPVRPLAERPGAGGGGVTLARTETAEEEADLVATWLGELRERVPDATAAVLCRKRAQFGPVIDALAARGIPHEVVGLGGLLLTPEVEDLVALLHVVEDAARGDHLMRLLTGPSVRAGIADLDGLAAWARHRQKLRLEQAGETPRDQAPDSADRPSIVEALDELPPPGWVGPEGERVGPVARERLAGLAAVVRRLRGLTALPLADLVGEGERALGLDIEVLSRAEYTPAAARAHLDAFADVAAQFAVSADRPTLGGFLAWVAAAIDQERGLDRGFIEASGDAVQVMTVHAAKGLEWDAVAVPGLVEAGFPDHSAKVSRPVDGAWVASQAKDKGWLAGLADGGIPFDLRGDRAGLPTLRWSGAEDWEGLASALARFELDGGDHAVGEERRLAYVAATRARHALLLSASVWTTASTPRLTSRFLLEVREAVAAGRLPAAERCWADLPEAGPDVVRPGGEEAAGAGWPVDAMAHRRPALAEAATRVRAAVADGGRPDVERDAPIASDGPPPPSRHQEIELLLAERDAGRARTGEPVQLGSHLSTSALVALARDRDAFTLDLRRPLPTAPARAARRGTAFHAWVEQHYAMAAMVDVSELPGSADDDPEGEEALETMKERFLASEWADRVPVEVETSVETVLDGVAVRGRIDAVFPREDGGFTVIDWKTGLPPTGEEARTRALQLAAYRVAFARLRGVDPDRVDAAFYYARTGETVRPSLPATEEITEVLRPTR